MRGHSINSCGSIFCISSSLGGKERFYGVRKKELFGRDRQTRFFHESAQVRYMMEESSVSAQFNSDVHMYESLTLDGNGFVRGSTR